MVGLPGIRHHFDDHHPNLVVTRTQAPCKERVLYYVGGLSSQVNLRVNDPDIGTLATALNLRVFRCQVGDTIVPPPLPSPRVVQMKLSQFGAKIGNFRSTPETYDNVVSQYVGRKRVIYENAMNSLLMNPANRRDAEIRPFVKGEKVPPNKAPRCIQPRSPRHCLEVGRYIKHIEHRIYKEIAKAFGDGPTVMKGYNVQQVGRICAGKWFSFRDPVAIGLDATKFDMHVSPAILQWEHDIYLKIYQDNPSLRRLLDRQMYNVGRGFCADGKLKYHTIGKRCSGDMNTALGNCIIMCAMVYSYAKDKAVPIKLMNNGDDCVVMMERSYQDQFRTGLEAWFLELGFRMEAEEPVYDIECIEFCQMHPINTVNGWTMVRNIPMALHKDTLCLLPLRNETEMKEWLGAIGDCGIALTHGVPVLNKFYGGFRKHGTLNTRFGEQLLMHSGMNRLRVGIDRVEDSISAEARYGVWLAWGILPDAQVTMETTYSNMQLEYGGEVVGSYLEIPEPTLL